MAAYNLPRYDADVLTADRAIADWFEEAVVAASGIADPKTVSNWVTGELFRLMREANLSIGEIKVTPKGLSELLRLVNAGTLNLNTAKEVLAEMFETGRNAAAIVEARGLAQISDTARLSQLVDEILAANPREVEQYQAGKTGLLSWFVGQVMRATRGQANPQIVNELLRTRLS